MPSDNPLTPPPAEPDSPTLRRLVVGDVHGDWLALLALLRQVGAIDRNGQRLPGWWLAQIGDLIHGGRSWTGTNDGRARSEGVRHFDVLLYGNHELPHAHDQAHFASFAGQMFLTMDEQRLLDQAIAAGRFSAAAVVDGWLLTHAGLHPTFLYDLGVPDPDLLEDAATCAFLLNDRFARRLRDGGYDPVFDAVGRARGGREAVGGIFWLDWADLCQAANANRLCQIVGHTPCDAGPEQAGNRLWCVDVGAALSGKVAALLRDGENGAWQPVVYQGRDSTP